MPKKGASHDHLAKKLIRLKEFASQEEHCSLKCLKWQITSPCNRSSAKFSGWVHQKFIFTFEDTVYKYMMLDVLQEKNSLEQSICFDWKTTINLGWINHRIRYEISKIGWKMFWLACENIRFSSLFVAWDVSRRGTSATQWQKFHTDDVNQC